MAEVGCAGILVADTFLGPLKTLPREGQLVTVAAMPSHAGGCAANVALDLAKQGLAADVAGCAGKDAAASVITAELKQAGIGCRQLVYAEKYPTSRTLILLIEGQDRRYFHMFGANAAFTAGHIRQAWLAGLKVFYVGGLFLMPAFKSNELLELLKFCRRRKVATVVDVVIPQQAACRRELEPLLPFIDYFLPNADEARALTGCRRAEDQARSLLAAGAGTVIVTRGAKGLLAARRGEAWRAGIYPVSVLDPSGAGDAFCSGVITGIIRQWNLPETLKFASALGASAVRAVGTTQGVFRFDAARAFVSANPLAVRKVQL